MPTVIKEVWAGPGGTAQAPTLYVEDDSGTDGPAMLIGALFTQAIVAGEQAVQVSGYWAPNGANNYEMLVTVAV